MIAIRAGFYAGERIRRGTEFEFNENETRECVVRNEKGVKTGTERRKVKPPAWAMPANDPAAAKRALAKSAEPTNGDTKPQKAQSVARQKNAEASEASGLV
jgi:hypothetical protein